MRVRTLGTVGLLVALGLLVSLNTGCNTVAMQQEINSLRARVAELEAEKQQELNELASAKDALIEQLSGEIADGEVKLRMAQQGLVVTVMDQVLFDSGKTELKPQSKSTLDKVAGVISDKAPGNELAFEGHTDSVPISRPCFPSNWELSTGRATSVLHYFVSKHGFDSRKLRAVGYGEFRPVASNDTPDGRAQNRRTEIVILPLTLSRPVGQ